MDEEKVTVTTLPCMCCGEAGFVKVLPSELAAYRAGALIQNAMPSLSAGEREQIINGTHDACFEQLSAETDEED